MPIALKVTTEYSLLKSLIKMSDLTDFLMKNKIKACAICDDELFGFMQFYLKCKENNIKPIVGLDLVINDNHYYVYAKNYEGYLKLLKINTLKYDKLVTYNHLDDNNLLVILPYESVENYQEFKNKNNIYIGFNNAMQKRNALLISENVLFVNNIRCLNRNDIQYLKYLNDLGGKFVIDENSYYDYPCPNEEDKKDIENFCKLIDIEIPFDKKYIPKYRDNSFEYLKALAIKGLEKRCEGNIPTEYLKRLDYELDIINQMGFIDYFLIVYDYVLYAKKHDCLVGPGRGSAAGSLVSYAIGITNIDPINYDLLFERFLNPSRKKMPDIDIDFEDDKRSEIISYVKEKYGNKNAVVGITFNSYKSKLILRDVAKILNIDNALLEKFIKTINGNKSLKENLSNEIVKKFLNIYKELNELYSISIHLEGLKKNISTHAAGVVISSVELDDIIPIYKENDDFKTGYAMEYLEKLGLLKMDFLGLRNLSIISSVVKSIPNFNLDDISLDDPEVFEIFKNADTDDIFQFESKYAKDYLLKLNVSNFNELSIAIALVRPGPNNQIEEYIENKNKKSFDSVKELNEILESTYGVIIFQEQVMKILEVIGGYTMVEADNVRVAMSKKNEDIINNEKEKFITKAIQKGYDKNFVVDLFNKIKKFAEYGFNKSHSVSYALIAYQMAYLKAHYKPEFTIALLNNTKDSANKKRLLNSLKQANIKILLPNINVSNNEYQYKNKYLLLPFNMIKNFNINLISEIIERKKDGYKDIFDFLIKCKDILNKDIYEMLVKSGVLDTFKISKRMLIENEAVLLNYADLDDINAEKPILEKYEEYDDNILRNFEIEYFGFYVGNHPCSVYQNVIKVKNTKDYLFKNINMILLVEKITKIRTKKGEDMAFIEASDETGNTELTLFPDAFKMAGNIEINDVISLNGKSSKRFDKYQIIVNNIKRK